MEVKKFVLETLFYDAVKTESLEIVSYMIQRDSEAVINYINNLHPEHGSTPLHLACTLGNRENLKLILQHVEEADINFKNQDGKTSLQLFLQSVFAPESKYNENLQAIMKLFVDRGADIFSTDDDGNTLLHLAVRENDLDMVNYLLDQGVNAEIVNNSDETTLHYAMFWRNTDYLNIVQLLLAKSADTNDCKSVEDASDGSPSGSGAKI